MKSIEVGIISDTHGLLRHEAVDALAGVSLILHAGDVLGPEILSALSLVAPVVCVRGNCDNDEFGASLPLRELVAIGGVWIYMHHGHNRLEIDPETSGIKVVISGHTHIPRMSQGNGILWMNPGSAGPSRFDLPVTVGRLSIFRGEVEARLINIMNNTETRLSTRV